MLILATDGVFDNLFQDEILSIVKAFSKNNGKTRQTALTLSRLIAEAAQQKSKKTNIKTPFNIKKAKAILEFKCKFKGGSAPQSNTDYQITKPPVSSGGGEVGGGGDVDEIIKLL